MQLKYDDPNPVQIVQNDMLYPVGSLHVVEEGKVISNEVEDMVGLFNSISFYLSTVFKE